MSPDVSLLEDTSTVCLDNLMIELCRDGTVGGSFYISYAEDVSLEEGKQAVMKCAKKYNAEVTIEPLGDIVSKNAESYDIVSKYLLAVALMVGVMEIIIVICMRMGTFYTERRQYGIMLASGGMRTEIIQNMFCDNLLIGGFACFIGNTIIATTIGFMVNTTEKTSLVELYDDIIFSRVIPITIVISVIIVLIETIVPSVIIARCSVADMMRKYNENSRIIYVIMVFSLFINNAIFISFYNLHLDFVSKAKDLLGKSEEIYDDYENLMLLDSANGIIMWILVAVSFVNTMSITKLVFMGKSKEYALKRCNGATGINVFADIFGYILKISVLSLVPAVVFAFAVSRIWLEKGYFLSVIPALALTFITAFAVVSINFRRISRNKALKLLRTSEE